MITDRFYLSLIPVVALNKETLVTFYPIPVTDQLNIDIKGQKSVSQITILDMSGKV